MELCVNLSFMMQYAYWQVLSTFTAAFKGLVNRCLSSEIADKDKRKLHTCLISRSSFQTTDISKSKFSGPRKFTSRYQ